MMHRRSLEAGLVAAMPLVFAAPVRAHHAMDGITPTTLVQGVLSGLAHPVIEIDHLVFLVALGLLAARQSHAVLLAAAFIVLSMAGVVARVTLGAPAGLEWMIAGSVIAAGAGVVVALRSRSVLGLAGLALAVACAGVAHGLAFGESIVGSEPTVLGGYLAGLAIVQVALVAGVTSVARSMLAAGATGALRLQTAGALAAAFGALQIGLMLIAA